MSEEEELDLELDDTALADSSASSALGVEFDNSAFADIYREKMELSEPTRCEFLTGVAGSGKSHEIRRRIEEDPDYAILSATTGIAAVNLNAATINSLLGYYNTHSLKDAYLASSAQRKLKELVEEGYKNVVIDEISMLSHDALDTIVQIFDAVNDDLLSTQHPIGLIIVGDMCQLPPIPDKTPEQIKRRIKVPTPWAFLGRHWERFEANTTRLTKNWRQADQNFLEALNHARSGRGMDCVNTLESCGLEFASYVDQEFDGTTILAENKKVERFNLDCLKRVQGRDMSLPSRRWGKERKEWEHIPEKTLLREGAYVMILSNKGTGERGVFEYVNGDCGHVTGVTFRTAPLLPLIHIQLVRTGQEVKVSPIVRNFDYKEKPDGFVVEEKLRDVPADTYLPKPHYNGAKRRYVAGQVQYYPIRLAYATTCHKAQGLSLDRVQVDMRDWQWKNPGMAYIAMSRGRTVPGLRIVGMKEVVAAACQSDPLVERWL